MFESLFGAEMPLPVRFFIAFLVVLGLIAVTAWVVRRFGADRLGAATARGRQPRLAVIDAAAVDGRRRLILIRRDNVEHLLMIGGPSDVVIEPNIVRAAAATREQPAPARASAAADTLPRALPLGDVGAWPLQPEPAPAARPQRSPAPEETTQWSAEAELPPSPPLPPPAAPRRQPRPADPLAGLAAELARAPEPPPPRLPTPANLGPEAYAPPRQREPVREPMREPAREREPMREPAREREPVREREVAREREPVREREPAREPAREREVAREREPVREREPARMRDPVAPPSAADPEFNANADQNLADMAQRLEAALRRPPKANEARPVEPPARAVNTDVIPGPPANSRSAAPPADAGPARAEPKPQKSLYDSLEKEMANLLGRPSGKS
jgi:flagellar protein FliO/FliZ